MVDLVKKKEYFKQRLSLAFKQSKISREDLSNHFNVSVQAVGKWFSKGTIAKERLPDLATILKVDYFWLVSGEGKMTNDPRDRLGAENIELREAIKKAREERNWTQEDLAKELRKNHPGVRQQNIQQFENGTVEQPRYIMALLKMFDLDINGNSSKEKKPYENVILWDKPEDLPKNEFVLIPVYDAKIAAGSGKSDFLIQGKNSIKNNVAYRSDFIRNNKKIHTTNLCILYADGDSMMPTIASGDALLIDMGQSEIKSGHVYAFTNSNGDEQVKRLYMLPDSTVKAVSDNKYDPTYSEPTIHKEIHIIGRIVERTGSGGL